MALALRTPEAEQDLREITFHIAVEHGRIETAERMVDAIVALCDDYARQPELGESCPQFGLGYRQFVCRRWVVIYRTIAEGIEVLRIVDGARDFKRLF